MDRSFDREDRTELAKPDRAILGKGRPASDIETAVRMRPDREGRCRLGQSELETLADLGRFRVIRSTELAQHRYGGNEIRMRHELRSLALEKLIQRKTVWTGQHRDEETFWTLTQEGKRLLKRESDLPSRQALYSGFVKPAELRHDAAIYAMFQKEAERLGKDGARIERVVLDFELKKKAYSPLAKAKALPPLEYQKRQAEIAQENGLKVVNGHIVLPDLRIEYETDDGRSEHVDLELATSSYHGSHASEKAAAGLRMYASSDTAGRLSRALDERGVIAEIFSL